MKYSSCSALLLKGLLLLCGYIAYILVDFHVQIGKLQNISLCFLLRYIALFRPIVDDFNFTQEGGVSQSTRQLCLNAAPLVVYYTKAMFILKIKFMLFTNLLEPC